MPHIDLPEGVPGIRSAMQFRPETAVHLNALAEQLLRTESTLSRGDRELVAAYVSSRNKTVSASTRTAPSPLSSSTAGSSWSRT